VYYCVYCVTFNFVLHFAIALLRVDSSQIITLFVETYITIEKV